MAAKRYYQDAKDRRDESRGMKRRDRGFIVADVEDRGADYFPTMSGEGREAIQKPGMIYEDRRAIANLPQEVMIKPYPVAGYGMPSELDDTDRGVRMQMDYDDSQRDRGYFPKKV